MTISPITSSITMNTKDISSNNSAPTGDGSFEMALKNALKEVNQTQVEGYKAMEGLATGDIKNIQEAVQKIEEAELSLKLALEVKTKALNAYKEVMRMQI
ncbi:MAG: flagellar hook-basal body complex protein FliE [Campylobacteraceae bacterium]|nr:flagellar hook-basal body complex protein FliE [Campylobacteraceae bacterium]